MKKEEE